MKQLLLMIALTLAGTVGAFYNPFWGVAIYHLFAILRPQFLWRWSLPAEVTWSYYVAIAAILASALAWLTGIGTSGIEAGRRQAVFTPAHKLLLGFGLWVLVSCMTAFNQEVAYRYFQEYLKIVVMFAVSAVLIRKVSQVWFLFLMMASALAYIAYEVNYQYLVNGYLGIFLNGYCGYDNNGAGLMLAMGVPLAYFAWEGISSRWRWAFLALLPILVHAVLLTYSRGAMIALVAVVPALLLRTRYRGRLALALVLLVVPAVQVMAGKEIQDEFFSMWSYDEDESSQSRFDSWGAGLAIAQDYPIFGVGVRNSNLFSFDYGADIPGRTIHNLFIQIAADSGFVGVGLYLATLAVTWRGIDRTRRRELSRTDDDPGARRIVAMTNGIECSLFLFCFGAIFLSMEVFEPPYLLILLGAQLAVLTNRSGEEHGVPGSDRDLEEAHEDDATTEREGHDVGF